MMTKDEIKMEFLKLYTEQGYDKINIKELCARIPIARTTFYTYYSNVDEVKSEIEDEVIAQLVKTSGDNVDKDYRNACQPRPRCETTYNRRLKTIRKETGAYQMDRLFHIFQLKRLHHLTSLLCEPCVLVVVQNGKMKQ